MTWKVLVALSLVAAALAGCVTPPSDQLTGAALDAGGLLAATEQVFADKQNAPHPLYGWPTLTNPATGAGVSEWWQPIEGVALPEHIAGIAHVAETKGDVESGGGIALFGRLAVVPGYGKPSSILDISDPTAPRLLSHFEQMDQNHRGAVIIAYPNGTLVTAISTGAGFEVFDITDPTMPAGIAKVEAPTGGHKIGVVPGTPIVYNANSRGADQRDPLGNVPGLGMGQTEIYDLTDAWNPVLVQEFKNGYGCHHIYFWNDASQEKYRATCAGIEYSQIWDVADPLNPEVIVNVPVHHGVAGLPGYSTYLIFAHFAILNDDGTILVVGDETGGGGLPPGCDARLDTPLKQVSGPLGNLYFYDVKDEKNPKLLGFVGMDTVLPNQASCTAHHGRLVPDAEGRDLLAMAFYGAGVGLIDFSDPTDPRVVDQWADNTDTWEVWYYNGYLFTGDLARGLDVLTFE